MTWAHLGAVISLLLEAVGAAAAHQVTAGRRMEVPAPRSTPHSAATVTVQPLFHLCISVPWELLMIVLFYVVITICFFVDYSPFPSLYSTFLISQY